MGLKAHYVLKQNIDALLQARGLKRKDLALWCHKTEGWLSQIFTNAERNMPLKYLDRIARLLRLGNLSVIPTRDLAAHRATERP